MRILVAATALLCMAGRPALAQESLALYGVVDLGIKYDGGTARTGAWSVSSGNRQGSRLGIRATEALSPGLRAAFVLESGFNADDGTLGNGGRLWGRQAWIGLEGDFGALSVGRQYSALYLALKAIDPFRIQEAGDMQRTFGYGVARIEPLSRSDNAVVLSSAQFGAWQARVGHHLGESALGARLGASSFADIAYETPSLLAHATWQAGRDLALGAAATLPGGLSQATGLAPSGARVRSLFLGAVVKLDAFKLHGGWGDTRLVAGRELTVRNLMLGLTVPAASGAWIASVNQVNLDGVAGATARQAAAGYSSRLSKRTELYVSASHTRNQHRVALNAATPGGSAHEMRTGLTHSF